jgi:hypothetical protein
LGISFEEFFGTLSFYQTESCLSSFALFETYPSITLAMNQLLLLFFALLTIYCSSAEFNLPPIGPEYEAAEQCCGHSIPASVCCQAAITFNQPINCSGDALRNIEMVTCLSALLHNETVTNFKAGEFQDN